MSKLARTLTTILAGIVVSLPIAADVPAAADYLDLRRVEPIRNGDVAAGQEKAAACIACHGGNGISPVSIFPNLRGQTVDYLYWALVDFKRSSRASSPMTPVVAPLSDQDLRDLAAFYAMRPGSAEAAPMVATPMGTADTAQLASGEQLYLHGKPAQGVPPCQGCHGADGSGNTRHLTYPALRGQKADYLVAKLGEYREKKLADSTTDFIMTGVAAHLDDNAIRDLAAWLSAQSLD